MLRVLGLSTRERWSLLPGLLLLLLGLLGLLLLGLGLGLGVV